MFGFLKRASSPGPGVELPPEVLDCLRQLRIDLNELVPLFNPQRSNAYVLPCKGKLGPSLWGSLRKELPPLGFWPAVLGDDESLARHREFAADAAQSPSDIIAYAASMNVSELLAQRRMGCLDPDNPDDHGPEDGEIFEKAELQKPFSSCLDDLSGKALLRVWIGLFPTGVSCDIPAHLGFGDWNACPKPHEHVALLKHWAQRYGVELVSATSDVIELRASRRPTTQEEALALAREQFFYCSDIVDQGVGSIATLASLLMEGDYWYFWWD